MNYIMSALVTFLFVPLASATWTNGKNIDYKVLEFNKGVASLTAQQKKELNGMLQDAKSFGKEIDVSIAGWADEPFPGANKTLSKPQQKLADQRIAAVKNHMKDTKIEIEDFETYSMAEGSNWLARLFNTESAELKSAFSSKDASAKLMKEKYQIFKERGDTGKTVVVFSIYND